MIVLFSVIKGYSMIVILQTPTYDPVYCCLQIGSVNDVHAYPDDETRFIRC